MLDYRHYLVLAALLFTSSAMPIPGVFPDLVQVIGGLTVVVDVKFEHEARIYGMGLIVCSVQDTVGAIFAR
ncbi:hypothetical protein CLAFUW4_12014 [Fulvia fulva]|uniref:Uncharacterized protein n=1 Tax=Passalora fulva TaxID=5499 RepID=A0A9Q8PF67_PASFU|nr:uncharacterized protein CLAFUR5_11053 [Fulvia fulva]KAK4618325.1 hypothetical protein CLAFUR4_12019 [Fulvia fulva]KAK4618655.1 hypothetical protein CLAFUR0_12030 [Fulvia fulva]UJO21378.1 hypothetical protein CLAFUR5_11053 [Fulvia fulva]WPV18082.1 hypothetical protein CLAFUW4_12014 [Fulvia fulva]WPV33275.1 hypothetical protein CLAFUW7_12021 [Fulvia fulva]